MPALSDSVLAAIGIDTIWSHFSEIRRDSPLPSEPTTMHSGSRLNVSSGRSTSPAVSRPTTKTFCFFSSSMARARLTTWATRIREAAPAEVFHAAAVIEAARRSGMITP